MITGTNRRFLNPWSLAFLAVSAILLLGAFQAAHTALDPKELRKRFPRSRQSEHFIIRYHPDDEKAASKLLHLAEKTLQQMSGVLGYLPRDQIIIFLAYTDDDFAYLHGGYIADFVAATAHPVTNIIALRGPQAPKGGPIMYGGTLAHELCHVLIFMRLGRYYDQIPVWLNEGLAQYFAKDWDLSQSALLSSFYLGKQLIPFPDLTDSFPATERQARIAYTQSLHFVSYFIKKYGKEAVGRILQGLSQGASFHTAFRQATGGVPFYMVEESWLRLIKIKYGWIPVVTSVGTLWGGLTILFLYIYFRKKRHDKKRLKQMEWEEMLEDGGYWGYH